MLIQFKFGILKKSSPLKLLSQSQPNFAEMILGWSSSKFVCGISEHRPRFSEDGHHSSLIAIGPVVSEEKILL
jgi:hypothetical protein